MPECKALARAGAFCVSEARPVEAVVFDVGRVLFRWDLRHLFAKLIDDPAELDWFLAHVVTEEWHADHDAGRPLDEMVAERKAAFPAHAHLIDAYANRFGETIPGPVPGSLELVEQLAAQGMPLFAITNFAAAFWEPFRAGQPVFGHFREIVVSGRERIAKPDPAIFRLAQARFGHEPSAMLFIDDNADNIATAREEGWRTHLFRDAGALAEELKALDVI